MNSLRAFRNWEREPWCRGADRELARLRLEEAERAEAAAAFLGFGLALAFSLLWRRRDVTLGFLPPAVRNFLRPQALNTMDKVLDSGNVASKPEGPKAELSPLPGDSRDG